MAAVEVKLDPSCLTATARELRHARDRLRCLFKTPSIVLLVLLGIAFMSMVFVSLNVFAVYFLLVPVLFVPICILDVRTF